MAGKSKVWIYSIMMGAALWASLSLGGCYNDNEQELYGTESCDTTQVTYSQTVAGILSANCYECHAANLALGGIVLDDWHTASALASSGRLLGAVKHEAPYSPMPKGYSKLIQCDIDKIERWVLNGAPDN